MHLNNVQIRYAAIYTLLTFVAMLLLNIFCSKIALNLFYANKESIMANKCKLASSEVGSLGALNHNTISNALSRSDNLDVTRVIVTDQNACILYDSIKDYDTDNAYALFPEIITALEGNDVFYCRYKSGTIRSMAASPFYSYGILAGCVYIMESDVSQGTIIAALQNTILLITLILEIIVVISSFSSANTYSRRIRKLMSAIRIVKKGDYSHRLQVYGNDELSTIGSEFNDLISRLQISESRRSQFVSDASHELKTPLASIKLLSDSILQNDMDLNTVKEFVSDIGNEADRLNRMSQKLLTLSRNDSTTIRDDTEMVKISSSIERVVRMLSGLALEKSITISQEIRSDYPILIPEDDLYQIIFNLIENGIKYNKDFGNLRIILDNIENNMVLVIADSGVGIPVESIDNIFERFYRVDKARSRSTGGSGLGLSIVKSMVEKNNGKIFVNSKQGIGSEFTVSFPVFDTEARGI